MSTKTHYQPNLGNGQIVVIGDDPYFRQQLVDFITKAGGRITNPLSFGFKCSDIENRLNSIAIICHIDAWNGTVEQSLSMAEKHCVEYDLPLLVLLPFDMLDTVLGMIHYPNVEFLMTDPASNLFAELLAILVDKVGHTRSAIFSSRDQPTPVDLRKLSEDVNRIARLLAQLTQEQLGGKDREPIRGPAPDPETGPKLADNRYDFREREDIVTVPYGKTIKDNQSSTTVSAHQIRNLIKARHLRGQYFDSELFADPAWDMLLDLLAAHLENKKVSVSSLCIAARVPPTTALRWIKLMTEEEIFLRKADHTDGRRIFIELSDDATAGMIAFFSTIQNNSLVMI